MEFAYKDDHRYDWLLKIDRVGCVTDAWDYRLLRDGVMVHCGTVFGLYEKYLPLEIFLADYHNHIIHVCMGFIRYGQAIKVDENAKTE